jgi:hypothetical protein
MKKLLLLSALLIFACSSDDSSDDDNDLMEETFLERYDGVFWLYQGLEDPNDPFFNQGCFFEDNPHRNTFFLTNNPPSQFAFDIFDPLLPCTSILFSNPNYIIVQNSENIFSYTYEDSEGIHMRTYTVSEGNYLNIEDDNCIATYQFNRTEVEFNPCP